MRSSSRNTRRALPAAGLAAAVSVLLGATAQAADSQHQFVLTVYDNVKGGTALLRGDYATALTELRTKRMGDDIGATSNNRCVALALSRRWEFARSACNEAVRAAQLEKVQMSVYNNMGMRRIENDSLAVALSNRAVLHWISDESAAAASDLKRAAALAPKADFITRNLTALQVHASVAQVTTAPQR